LLPIFDGNTTALDGTNTVPDYVCDDEQTPTPHPELGVGSGRSARDAVLALPMALTRREFIWKFGEREGIKKSVFKARWNKRKNGYPTRYDRPFAAFQEWWRDTYRALEYGPANISPGLVAEYLGTLADLGCITMFFGTSAPPSLWRVSKLPMGGSNQGKVFQ